MSLNEINGLNLNDENMEPFGELRKDNKYYNRAKSHHEAVVTNTFGLKKDSAKRKSFNPNEAMMSLDLALGRLKRSKKVSKNGVVSASTSPIRRSMTREDLYLDTRAGLKLATSYDGIAASSVLSVNLSDYEMMRNLSRANSSEGAFSGPPDSSFSQPISNEQLEKYFRSVEMWNKFRETESIQFKLPENK